MSRHLARHPGKAPRFLAKACLPFILLLPLVLAACTSISYKDNAVCREENTEQLPVAAAQLAELKKILAKYGQVIPEKKQPGFVVQNQDYTIRARIVGCNMVDVSVYWKPDKDCQLRLPLVIADIKSRMGEVFAGEYTLQAQQ